MLAHVCLHAGLSRDLATAMREREAQDTGCSERPRVHGRDAQAEESLLRGLAAICSAPQLPQAAGTPDGGAKTVRWLVEEVETSARRCHAAAGDDGAGGGAELLQASSILAAALEVSSCGLRELAGMSAGAELRVSSGNW